MNPDILQSVLTYAREEAIRFQHPYIRSEHLLLALLQVDNTILPISYAQLSQQVLALPKPKCGAEQKLDLAQGAKRALQQLDNDPTMTIENLAIGDCGIITRFCVRC